jgi:hypothetical protein
MWGVSHVLALRLLRPRPVYSSRFSAAISFTPTVNTYVVVWADKFSCLGVHSWCLLLAAWPHQPHRGSSQLARSVILIACYLPYYHYFNLMLFRSLGPLLELVERHAEDNTNIISYTVVHCFCNYSQQSSHQNVDMIWPGSCLYISHIFLAMKFLATSPLTELYPRIDISRSSNIFLKISSRSVFYKSFYSKKKKKICSYICLE